MFCVIVSIQYLLVRNLSYIVWLCLELFLFVAVFEICKFQYVLRICIEVVMRKVFVNFMLLE